MAVTLRFRPVLGGVPERPSAVLYLLEEPDGRVLFRELEYSWRLPVALDAVSQADLPSPYQQRDLEISILPTQEAEGETREAAHAQMLEALDALHAGVQTARTSPEQIRPA